MHSRYPASNAMHFFGEESKIRSWRRITDAYAMSSIGETEVWENKDRLFEELNQQITPHHLSVKTREQSTGHDVVAFLSMYTQDMSDDLKRHIHVGLTSSDLVEYSHHYAMWKHAEAMIPEIDDLRKELHRWEAQVTTRAGRTHGQIAALTSWNHQMKVIDEVLVWIRLGMLDLVQTPLVKSPGPTGNSPWLNLRARKVAFSRLGGARLVASTQVIPRDYQIRWAALYLRLAVALENLALQVRLGSRSEVAEVREGASAFRVGSSAMPHKKNPIDSEKVCGLARVARGYFTTIAEGAAMWEDRDLTNSSMERIAVPDLAAVVEHMLDTMIDVMHNLEVHVDERVTLRAAVWSNVMQMTLQEACNMGPIEASAVVREAVPNDKIHVGPAIEYMHGWLREHRDEDTADRWDAAFSEYQKHYRVDMKEAPDTDG